MGQELSDRDTIFEFYIIPPYRKLAIQLFQKLIEVSGVKFIECQTNDFLLHSLTLEFSESVSSSVILFSDHTITNLDILELAFRRKTETDILFEHKVEPEGSHVIEWNGEVVATGGFLLQYNVPFADLYMEVREDAREKGVGSYLIQELKKECYLAGRIPAARCNIENHASRATLLKAGMKVSGFMLMGAIRVP
jgi:GNAT superfamily N-acetyltransferase